MAKLTERDKAALAQLERDLEWHLGPIKGNKRMDVWMTAGQGQRALAALRKVLDPLEPAA